jgi:hypothetical protein
MNYFKENTIKISEFMEGTHWCKHYFDMEKKRKKYMKSLLLKASLQNWQLHQTNSPSGIFVITNSFLVTLPPALC